MKNFKNFFIDALAIGRAYAGIAKQDPYAEYGAWEKWAKARGFETPEDTLEKIEFYAAHEAWADLANTRLAKTVSWITALIRVLKGGWRNV